MEYNTNSKVKDVKGERKSKKMKKVTEKQKSGYKKCHISSKLHTWRRSDWHPHNMTGTSGRCCRSSLIHLFLTLYSEMGSLIL